MVEGVPLLQWHLDLKHCRTLFQWHLEDSNMVEGVDYVPVAPKTWISNIVEGIDCSGT